MIKCQNTSSSLMVLFVDFVHEMYLSMKVFARRIGLCDNYSEPKVDFQV